MQIARRKQIPEHRLFINQLTPMHTLTVMQQAKALSTVQTGSGKMLNPAGSDGTHIVRFFDYAACAIYTDNRHKMQNKNG